MTFKSGLIYSEFDQDTMVVPTPSPLDVRGMHLFVGIDTGAYFGAVLVGLRPDGTGIVLDEVYTQKVKIDDSAAEVREMIVRALSPAFEDPNYSTLRTRVDSWIVDPHDLAWTNAEALQSSRSSLQLIKSMTQSSATKASEILNASQKLARARSELV